MLRYVSIENLHSYRTSEKSSVFLVIFAETMNNESICFYDFELDVWKNKKKIDKKEFQVRCEKVQWSKEVEISQCDQECNLSVSKTCQSQFDSFCPTIRICSYWKFECEIIHKIVWLTHYLYEYPNFLCKIVGISLIISEQYARLTKKCDNCIVDNISSPEINSELVESKF